MGYGGSTSQEVGIFHLQQPNNPFLPSFRRAEDYWQSETSARGYVFASGVDNSNCDHPFSTAPKARKLVESCIAKQTILQHISLCFRADITQRKSVKRQKNAVAYHTSRAFFLTEEKVNRKKTMVPVGDEAKRCGYPSCEEQSEEKTTIMLRPPCGQHLWSTLPDKYKVGSWVISIHLLILVWVPYWWLLLLHVMLIRPVFNKIISWGISLNFVLSFLLCFKHICIKYIFLRQTTGIFQNIV